MEIYNDICSNGLKSDAFKYNQMYFRKEQHKAFFMVKHHFSMDADLI